MATGWCADRSWSGCSARRCTRRSAPSSGRSIRTGCSTRARSSTRPAAHRQPALRRRLPDPESARRLRPRRLRRPRARGGDVQRRRRLPQDAQRDDVPVLHGDARRGALDARPRQRAADGNGRRARPGRTPRRRAWRTRRVRRAGPVPRVPGVQDGVSDGRRHGAAQERVPRRLLAPARHPGARARARTHPRSGGADRALGAAGQPVAGERAGSARSASGCSASTAAARCRAGRRARSRTAWRDRGPARAGPPDAVLFNDTFTSYFDPEVGLAAADVLEAAGLAVGLGPDACCGRPLISQGLLSAARERAADVVRRLHATAAAGTPIVLLEPSCLSALVDDVPALLRGEAQSQARDVAGACILFEDYLRRPPRRAARGAGATRRARGDPVARPLPPEVAGSGAGGQGAPRADPGRAGHRSGRRLLRHGGVVRLRAGAPGNLAADRRGAGCCPPARGLGPGGILVAAGTSCRHQVRDFAGVEALHPAVLLRSLLT